MIHNLSTPMKLSSSNNITADSEQINGNVVSQIVKATADSCAGNDIVIHTYMHHDYSSIIPLFSKGNTTSDLYMQLYIIAVASMGYKTVFC